MTGQLGIPNATAPNHAVAFGQLGDYATLTDNKGRKADFRNVLIIMTSNAGASIAMSTPLGFNTSASVKKVDNSKIEDAVKGLFTPEFRNRLTKTIVFNPMDDAMAENYGEYGFGG